jgi:Undecaprenyl-phosphate galactose phosphotransferase WbaP
VQNSSSKKFYEAGHSRGAPTGDLPESPGLDATPVTRGSIQWVSALGLFVGDLLAFFLAIGIAGISAYAFSTALLRSPYLAFDEQDLREQALVAAGLILGLCIWFARAGHYTERRSIRSELAEILSACSIGLLINGFVEFADKTNFSRLWIVLAWVFFGILLPLFRLLSKRILTALGVWVVNAVVVGKGAHGDAVKNSLMKDSYLGYNVVSDGSLASLAGRSPGGLVKRLDDLLQQTSAHTVILVPSDYEVQYLGAIIDLLNVRMVPYKIVPPIDRMPLAGLSTQSFINCDAVLLTVHIGLASPLSQAVKRAFDVAMSALLLVPLALPFIMISVAVAADGGPIFFAHERVGRHGRRFSCFKFRTMVPNAAAVLDYVLANDPAAGREWRATHKLREDPRTTRLGTFLRATSIDEVPQLINVLRGDMSLVGPRPVVQQELHDHYGSDNSYYLLVRPGITGLWQVSGRNDIDYERRVQLDAWYVRNWSLWNDLVILAQTVPVVIARHGAY